MKLDNYGFIMLGAGFEPTQKSRLESPAFAMTVCAVSDMEAAVTAARELVVDGVQLIELCGAFKGEMVDAIIDGIEGAVPVGHMTYSDQQQAKLKAFLAG